MTTTSLNIFLLDLNFEKSIIGLHFLFLSFILAKFLENQRLILWGSKTWAHDLGSGTTFHQQYARGEEIIENRCN